MAYTRAREIAAAIEKCRARGGSVHFLTLTLRHDREDRLSDLFTVLSSGWSSITSGSAWAGTKTQVGDRSLFGVAGFVRVVEATVTPPGERGHGWHLHIHALFFSVHPDLSRAIRDDVDDFISERAGHPVKVDRAWLGRTAFACRVGERFRAGVVRAGGAMPGTAGVDLRPVEEGSEFIGRYLEKATYDVAVRMGRELGTGDVTKVGRGSVTPFQLLWMLVHDPAMSKIFTKTPRHWRVEETPSGWEIVDTDTGELTPVVSPGAWRLWHEWEQATHGKRRVVWALRPRGKRATRLTAMWSAILNARGRDADASDVDVASRVEEIGYIDPLRWESWVLREPWIIENLIDEVARHGSDGLNEWKRRARERESIEMGF